MIEDKTVLDEWYALAEPRQISAGQIFETRLLGQRVELGRNADGTYLARAGEVALLPPVERFGMVWGTLGQAPKPFFHFPEFDEPDRTICNPGSFGVSVSGLRLIENFLDMGHFPFVHAGYLGEEPFTEVEPYQVRIDHERDEVVATECRFYQPRAAASAGKGDDVQYIYRAVKPFAAILLKTCPLAKDRFDALALFVQPVSEDECVAHTMMAYIDATSRPSDLRIFQQTIFAQDRPILQNQVPRRLPLDHQLEIPARVDATSVLYRRWLRDKGVTYGTYR